VTAMFDATAHLIAWNRNFQQMPNLPDAFLAGRPSVAESRYLSVASWVRPISRRS
jgi:hypothetical protein